jgi:hypothetical protein
MKPTKHRPTQREYFHTQTSAPRVRFEPTILVSERAKTVHDLDGAATVIVGSTLVLLIKARAMKYSNRSITTNYSNTRLRNIIKIHPTDPGLRRPQMKRDMLKQTVALL